MAIEVDEEFRPHAEQWGRFIRLTMFSAAGLAVILVLVAAVTL